MLIYLLFFSSQSQKSIGNEASTDEVKKKDKTRNSIKSFFSPRTVGETVSDQKVFTDESRVKEDMSSSELQNSDRAYQTKVEKGKIMNYFSNRLETDSEKSVKIENVSKAEGSAGKADGKKSVPSFFKRKQLEMSGSSICVTKEIPDTGPGKKEEKNLEQSKVDELIDKAELGEKLNGVKKLSHETDTEVLENASSESYLSVFVECDKQNSAKPEENASLDEILINDNNENLGSFDIESSNFTEEGKEDLSENHSSDCYENMKMEGYAYVTSNAAVQGGPSVNVEDYVECEKCGNMVLIWEMPEHHDFHFAMELQNDLNTGERGSNSVDRGSNSVERTLPAQSKKRKSVSMNEKSKKKLKTGQSQGKLDLFFTKTG